MVNKINLSEFINNIKIFNYYINITYNLLKNIKINYPHFDKWFYNKVVTDIYSKKREISIYYNKSNIIAITVLKSYHEEKKLAQYMCYHFIVIWDLGSSL